VAAREAIVRPAGGAAAPVADGGAEAFPARRAT
jgi:hypothetical protein